MKDSTSAKQFNIRMIISGHWHIKKTVITYGHEPYAAYAMTRDQSALNLTVSNLFNSFNISLISFFSR